MGYIAHTGEELLFRSVGSESTGETATSYWVGTTPRLEIRDADGGYARLTAGSPFTTWVVAYLAPFALSWPLYIDVQVRFGGAWTVAPTAVGVSLGINDAGLGHFLVTQANEDRLGLSVGPWHDVTLQQFPTIDEGEIVAAAAAGDLFIAFTTVLAPDDAYDLSFLGLRGDSARPLRWRQRNDGLGGSSPRAARGVTSQQGSSRHRGYL